MLKLDGITKTFRKNVIVKQVSLELTPGVYGLLGPNGAGKTTLIRCLTGLYRYVGTVYFNGVSTRCNGDFSEQVGYLPQKFGAYQELTVEENLQYFCELKNISKENRKAEIERVLEEVNLATEAKKRTKHLSGGMLRRLGIAQALLGDPQIIIFDEPTAGLDPEERLRFKMVCANLSKHKIIIISTHIVEDIDSLCEKIIILNQGEVQFCDAVKKLRAIALNKTYVCSESDMCLIKGKYFIEKRFEINDRVMYRFVATEEQPFERVLPEIEDGYICVLEKI